MGCVRWLSQNYMYYDIPLQCILYLYYVGGHQLLLSLSGPLDMPYPVELWCIGARSTSAWRLPATHKTGTFIAKKWQEIAYGGAYDVICSALWQRSGHFGGKHSWTHGQTMFPLFLKGYSYNQQFVIWLGWSGHHAPCDTVHWTRLRQPKPKNS